ncbi:GD16293 [Drosophila simulans]|uniref:GD16293 n=1 Tax=Drosophila simulans TaxID=7240 RepID=B4R4I6_DROSI|nr:GD16293 [Drosophila simulans]
MNVHKRPRLEMEFGSSTSNTNTSTSSSSVNSSNANPTAGPGLMTIANHHTADLSEALVNGSFANGQQSLILTSDTGNPLMNSQGAQIFLTICGDENSDDSQEYYTIKQEPGCDLDIHSLLPSNLQLPNNLQLPTGCEIYLVKETGNSLMGEPPTKAAIKLELDTLNEKPRLPPVKTSSSTQSAVITAQTVNPPIPGSTTTSSSSTTTTSVLYGSHGNGHGHAHAHARSQPESAGQTPSSKLEAYKKRDDKRRATHNEVERRRRDKINSWIFKLKEMLPSLSSSSSFSEASTSPSTSGSTSTNGSSKGNASSSNGRAPPNDSKSQILIKACEYIKSMQGEIDTTQSAVITAQTVNPPIPGSTTTSSSSTTTTSVLYGSHGNGHGHAHAHAHAHARSQPESAGQTPSSKLEAYKKRDDKRRATHNEVERRRRDKINSWIFKLKEMLPSLSSSSSFSEASTSPSTSGSTSTNGSSKGNASSSNGRAPPNDSKSQILIKACEYIKSMQGEIDTLRDCLRETDSLRASNQALREELDRLKRQQQLQERFHTASGRSTFNVTLNSLNSSATSDLFEGIDTTPNLAAVSSLGFGKRGLLISDFDE